MSDAIVLFYEILKYCVSFVFERCVIVEGVTLGWVLISVIIFSMLIGSILSVPRSATPYSFNRHKKDNDN